MIKVYEFSLWKSDVEVLFPKQFRLHTKHKLIYSRVKFHIFKMKWFRQTSKIFKQPFTQRQSIQISLGLAETTPGLLSSFMQTFIRVRYQQVSLSELLDSWKMSESVDNLLSLWRTEKYSDLMWNHKIS